MAKKMVFSLLALCCFTAQAENGARSISVELLGAQNVAGLNYDSRFKGNSGLGYRVGVGFGYGDNSHFLYEENIKGIGVPLELNMLLGKKRHKLEVGCGTSLGVYHVKETKLDYHQPVAPETEGYGEWSTSTNNRFGYFMFGDIGYRYQRDHGFLFRAGFSPSFNFGDRYGLHKTAFYPYIGMGWSF